MIGEGQHINQWNRTESKNRLNTNTTDFDKEAEAIQWEKKVFSTNGAGHPYVK